MEHEKFEPKKFEPKKFEPKKFEPKKFEPKKFETKKFEPKKFELKKFEPKKFEPKKFEPKKFEPKSERFCGLALLLAPTLTTTRSKRLHSFFLGCSECSAKQKLEGLEASSLQLLPFYPPFS